MASRTLRRLLTEVPAAASEGNGSEELFEDHPRTNIFTQVNLLPEIVQLPVLPESDSDCPEHENKTKLKHKTKSKKKKKKRREKSPDMAEFDATPTEACCYMSTKPPDSNNNVIVSMAELLSVNMKTLDPMLELGRMFGESTRLGDSRPSHSQRSLKRGSLVRIKPTWPPVIRFGFDMIQLPDESYSFTHTNDYRKMQRAFYAALDSMDPSNLISVLNECPYHVDASLQLSDLFIQQDNSESGIDLLERVLHAYQSAFDPRFNPSLAICRLDFLHQENRGLYVTLFRYANVLGSRGCYRNALDYTKILLGLNVSDDPLAALLMIDHYALLSRQLEFLVQLYDRLNPCRNLYLLPNFALSVALASRLLGKVKGDRNADELLQDALIMFPGFLTRLLKHITIGGGVTNLDKSVLFGVEVSKEPESLGRLLDLYVARTHQLWTSPDVHSWLEKNIESVLSLVERRQHSSHSNVAVDPRLAEYSLRRKTLYPALPLNIVRHLILADITEAPPILPRDRAGSAIYRFDPLPPTNSIDIYNPDEDRHQHRLHQRSEGLVASFFTSLFPDYVAGRQYDTANPSVLADVQHNLTVVGEWLTSALRNSHILNPSNNPAEPDDYDGGE